jgi:hypothetical protein
MAEERTISNFTWLTPPLRATLSVVSMARMTQIRQYYASEKQHSVCMQHITQLFVSLLTSLIQLRQKSHPRMKYFEAKAQNKGSSLREPEIAEPAADDTLWPESRVEGEAQADRELEFHLTARTTSLLDLDSSWLADLLSEKPTQKGPQVQSVKVVAAPQVLNNNFSLLF